MGMKPHKESDRLKEISVWLIMKSISFVGFQLLLMKVSYLNNLILVIDTIKKSNESGMSDILKKPMSYETLS